MMEWVTGNEDLIMIALAVVLGIAVMWLACEVLYDRKEQRKWNKYSKMMWKNRHTGDKERRK